MAPTDQDASSAGTKSELEQKEYELKLRNSKLTLIGLCLTAFGLGLGAWTLFQETQNRTQAIVDRTLENKNRMETDIALKFLDLNDRDDQAAFALTVDKLGSASDEFVARLYAAVPPKPPIVDDTNADTSLKALANGIELLTSTKTEERRQARTSLTTLIDTCTQKDCLSLLDASMNGSSVASSEVYRKTLGISVALGATQPFTADLKGTDAFKSIVEKLKTLSAFKEPALQNAAIKASKNLER
jgi:hypothetical protein